MTGWVDEESTKRAVHLDHSKAFGIVFHNILIDKLRKYALGEFTVTSSDF